MRFLLDDEPLNGSHPIRVTYRPSRRARPVVASNREQTIQTITEECQCWAGANTPIIPLSDAGEILPAYAAILAGSEIDFLQGFDHYALYHVKDAALRIGSEADVGLAAWGRQLAIALMRYQKQSTYIPLEIVELDNGDPWHDIYIACLGMLPEKPDSRLLESNRLLPDLAFEDFFSVRRITSTGSVHDLISRLASVEYITPRQLSMNHLDYGNLGSTAIRQPSNVLPNRNFARWDAGPNILVVCSPGNTEDLALLWNLRAAHGDHGVLPFGIPINVLTNDVLAAFAQHPQIARNGISPNTFYVTSASIPVDELEDILPQRQTWRVKVAPAEQLLTLGHAAGWSYEEVLTWHDSKTGFVPHAPADHKNVLDEPGFSHNTNMHVDLHVSTNPFPAGDDIRVQGFNETFHSGAASWSFDSRRTEPIDIGWPSRLLMAHSVANCRSLEFTESEPGRAARVAIGQFGSIGELTNLAHAPLLQLLEEIAARSGFGWYKQRMRDRGQQADPLDAVGPTTDELPEKSYGEFKKVLGNSEKATKYWLEWAERSGVVVKGFQLQCPSCRAKQWTPVSAFLPPIVCRGCADPMDFPFGNRPNVNFMYRLSERFRRLYEHDAMGHLIALRYLISILSPTQPSTLIGAHPGMEVRAGQQNGEADILLLYRNSDFVPIEVKRSFSGVSALAVESLDRLADMLRAPWSALVVCDYAYNAPPNFASFEDRSISTTHFRRVLSYDKLLEPQPAWMLNDDPFEWSPLEKADIAKREQHFVKGLVERSDAGPFDWLAMSMLMRPPSPK